MYINHISVSHILTARGGVSYLDTFLCMCTCKLRLFFFLFFTQWTPCFLTWVGFPNFPLIQSSTGSLCFQLCLEVFSKLIMT